jgi:hypothetical protein
MAQAFGLFFFRFNAEEMLAELVLGAPALDVFRFRFVY